MVSFPLLLMLILSVATPSLSDSDSVASLSPSDSSSSISSSSSSDSSSIDDVDDYYDDDAPGTTSIISTEDLCECFTIDLVYTLITEQNTVCYFYIFNQASTESYCSETLDYIVLESNADECYVTIDDILTQYSPDCCIDTQFDGTFVDGIQFILNTDDTDDSDISGVSSSVSSSSSSYSSSSSDTDTDDVANEDPTIVSLCFDATVVSGTQESAQIEIKLGDNIFECTLTNMIPDLCGNVTPIPTTVSPAVTTVTTATPTTSSPTTTSPTTATPTTATPTTATPTTATPTTATPTTATPTFSVCATNDSFNIAFVLDESGSVDADEWQNQIEFVDRLITYDVPATSAVSLFEFAALPDYTQFLDWTTVEDRTVFTDALNNNPYSDIGHTFTWDAMNRVMDNFWNYRFNCTDGCDTRNDVLILVTDGRPTDDVCPDMIQRVNQSDIDIVVIGIGLDDAATAAISCLDYKDGGVDIISVDSFDDITLNSIELEIRETICSGGSPATPSIRPEDGTQWDYGNNTIGLGPVPTVDPDPDGTPPPDT